MSNTGLVGGVAVLAIMVLMGVGCSASSSLDVSKPAGSVDINGGIKY